MVKYEIPPANIQAAFKLLGIKFCKFCGAPFAISDGVLSHTPGIMYCSTPCFIDGGM